MVKLIGFIAAVLLPLWNIPLILRIHRRRSSTDISVPWALGVFTCLLLMLPSALTSPDLTFRIFGILNVILFGAVVVQVVRFRSRAS